MGAVWVEQTTLDEIRSLIKNIKVYNGDIQYWGSGKNAGINIVCGGEENTGDNSYNGPFSVYEDVNENKDKVLMMSGGFIDIGLEPMEIEDYELTLTATGWVYLKITYDTAYVVEVLNAAEFPEQKNDELYIRIAQVEFEDDAVKTITQYQYGGINLFGRVI